jgi:uncharacterized protein (PEP-CTERM system associated)
MATRSDAHEALQITRRVCASRHYARVLLAVCALFLQYLPVCARAQYPSIPPREPGSAGGIRHGWEFHPTISAEETYTDNVRLAPSGAERSDWVTTVRPGFTLRNSGPRLRADLTYAPQLIYRAREESRDIFHYLKGYATAEVVNDLLYLDGEAYMARQNTSLLGPQADSDVNRTGNRTSVRSYNISPYLRHNFRQQFQGELRYSRNAVQYGTSSLYNSEADRVDAGLKSGAAYKALAWDLSYMRDHIRYTQTQQSIDMQRVRAGATRLITPNVGILLNAGYEDNSFITTGPAPKGKFWSVGPEWKPTPRTRLAATVGRRYFGPTYMVDFTHRTRITTWALNYDEDVTTGRGQALIPTSFDTASYLDTLMLPRIPDPGARQAAVQTLMSQTGLPTTLTAPVNYITTVPFLQKRLRATFGITGVRNTVLAHAFRQTRDTAAADAAVLGQVGAGDLALSPRTVQTGAGALWSLRISPVTTSNLSIDVTRNEFPAISREDTVTTARLALVKQFQPRLSGTIAIRRLQLHSNQAAASYRENAVVVGMSMTF